ncbi:molybdate-binding periplasmic protein ModA [Agarivorans sp. Toyoura001]|uniref:molybdate ABC transporter substrate-binding protein n=1 Tax=Agarivorans sp. Toyoura001 TaxID=2283141 RepID=UPI0010CF79FB|nr:molybdate ABC transporter substrate-binding protein [Agarivorans sp. Toyoura001]GDY26068.1 molybdate-binding periplasmic protein ModA [Agarivorans sp. Toyoura001]
MKKSITNYFPQAALAVMFLFSSEFVEAAEVKVAVAANFYKPVLAIADQYQQETGHQVSVSAGSTGKLYAQIKNGAPFEVFLAADQKRPSLLVEQGLAKASSQFTYAKGTLVLWSSKPELVDAKGEILNSEIKHLAICNPKTAPYGAAAVSALQHLGIYQQLQSKFVEGQSVGQTYQQISSGAVDLGFVALSQVLVDSKLSRGSMWLVPSKLYAPIKQDAVLLNKGDSNPAAQEFIDYLRENQITALIKGFGYEVE